MSVLIVNLCKEKMHELEFVQPVFELVQKAKKDVAVRSVFRLKKSDLEADQIILCGTSLADFDYLKHHFPWLLQYRGDVLGICAGAQVLAKLYGARLYPSQEIGKISVQLQEDLFFLPKEFFVYSLHTLAFNCPAGFHVVGTSSSAIQIFKKEEEIDGRKRMILGTLFHPEVLNKELIEGFLERI